jgi:hypothetical protein
VQQVAANTNCHTSQESLRCGAVVTGSKEPNNSRGSAIAVDANCKDAEASHHDIHPFCTPLWALGYLGVVNGVRAILPKHDLRLAFGLTVVMSLVGFRFAVLQPDYFKPDNRLLAIANEHIAAVPPESVLLPWKLDGNNALQALFRRLQASGDSGPIRTLRYVKHCDPHLYFTDGGRKSIRIRRYAERRVGRLEKCAQDLFVMECGEP